MKPTQAVIDAAARSGWNVSKEKGDGWYLKRHTPNGNLILFYLGDDGANPCERILQICDYYTDDKNIADYLKSPEGEGENATYTKEMFMELSNAVSYAMRSDAPKLASSDLKSFKKKIMAAKPLVKSKKKAKPKACKSTAASKKPAKAAPKKVS